MKVCIMQSFKKVNPAESEQKFAKQYSALIPQGLRFPLSQEVPSGWVTWRINTAGIGSRMESSLGADNSVPVPELVVLWHPSQQHSKPKRELVRLVLWPDKGTMSLQNELQTHSEKKASTLILFLIALQLVCMCLWCSNINIKINIRHLSRFATKSYKQYLA